METIQKYIICIHTEKDFPPHVYPNSDCIYYAGMKFGQMQFAEKESGAKKFDFIEECSVDFVHISNYVHEKLKAKWTEFEALPFKPVKIKVIEK